MAETLGRGPFVSVGSLMDGRVEPLDGPSIEYQGDMIPNPAVSPANKDSLSPAVIPGWYSNPYFVLVDTIPSANSSVTIAAQQAVSTTPGVALSLVTTQAGTAAGVPVFAPGIPIVPVGTSVATTVGVIDFGFTTGTTAANSTTVTVVDNSLFQLGQWLVIPGVGGTTNKALFTQIQSLSTNSTVITVSPAPQTALNNVPIGQANLYSQFLPPATQFGPSGPAPSGWEPFRSAGFGKPLNPLEGSCRALSVTAQSIGSGTTSITVIGYDIYGNPLQETIQANGTTTVNGKKAFKAVLGIQVAASATTGVPAQIAVGVSDVFGISVRSDKWEYLNAFWNGGFAVNNTGWTAALTTAANLTTIDVRGTFNASVAVIGTGVLASSNGARRLTIMMSVPLQNMINATPLNTVSLLGTAQI
jgi:hypothetical protein